MSNTPVPYKVTSIGVGGIAVPSDRLRALRPETVDALAASMATEGLLQPIVVRPSRGLGYTLVIGRHRYMAAQKLKWDHISAVVVELSDAEAEMAEIDENLIRAELTPAERADHTGKRKKLYEELYPKTKAGKAPPKRSGKGGKLKSQNENLTFVKDTAEKTGQGCSTVARDATRASKVAVLADIKGTSLDKGTELDALAKLSEKEQRELAAKAAAGEKVSAVSLLGNPETSTETRKATNEKLFGDAAAAEKVAAGVEPVCTEEKAPAEEKVAEETAEEKVRKALAEERASARAERAARVSARHLSEFTAAAKLHLPKLIEADLKKACLFVSKWYVNDGEAAGRA
jgi:ParB family chromosome partitioning protein